MYTVLINGSSSHFSPSYTLCVWEYFLLSYSYKKQLKKCLTDNTYIQQQFHFQVQNDRFLPIRKVNCTIGKVMLDFWGAEYTYLRHRLPTEAQDI